MLINPYEDQKVEDNEKDNRTDNVDLNNDDKINNLFSNIKYDNNVNNCERQSNNVNEIFIKGEQYEERIE